MDKGSILKTNQNFNYHICCLLEMDADSNFYFHNWDSDFNDTSFIK